MELPMHKGKVIPKFPQQTGQSLTWQYSASNKFLTYPFPGYYVYLRFPLLFIYFKIKLLFLLEISLAYNKCRQPTW